MNRIQLHEGRLDVRLISAQALRQYMEFRGHSVRSLAAKVGVSHGTIGWLTSGQRTTTKPETAKRIAKALDCPVQSLFVPIVVHGSRTKERAA
jgi:transcriptional regulator with XRE-family HTH domain